MGRILNAAELTSHGHIPGRRAVLDILEAGLAAADPYQNVRKLVRREGQRLIVGNPDYVPRGSPRSGDEVIDLDRVGRIYVVGAAKGIQYAAKALEEVLGDRLTGGHVIAKHGDEHLLERIGVSYGAHPVPDEGCVRGCQEILALLRGLRPEDLVFTIVGNGVSALLTLPAPGITLEEVRQTTYLMQIERGVPTGDLNPVRNHVDMMKGARMSRALQPAKAIHILLMDPSGSRRDANAGHDALMHRNVWLHSLPDGSTFGDAVGMLHKWQAWEAVPASVRAHLLRADPAHESVKADEFARWNTRIFGVMPLDQGMVPTARRRAEALGYRTYCLSSFLQAEASQAGCALMDIAREIEREGEPFQPPCALFSTGELLVTVGKENGVGGRNQEYALAAALRLAGSRHVVVGAVDSDGTDGPGTQFSDLAGTIPCLAGGLVDGTTAAQAKGLGMDLHEAIRQHHTTPALWQLKSGIVAAHNISMGDLNVILISGRE
jgi:glycerate-2-kinase